MSVIDTTGTEVAIPEAHELSPARLAAVCTSAIEWASTSDSITAIRDAANRFDAIARYMSLTSRDHLAEVEATKRRLEVRIGELLGPATLGHDRSAGATSLTNEVGDLTPNQRHDFRQMAEHADVVDEVIAESTDDAPASRRKVTDEIKRRAADAERLKAELADQAEVAERLKESWPDDFDPAVNRELIRQRGELARLCVDLVAIGDPDDFLDRHHGQLRDSHRDAVRAATEWLNKFDAQLEAAA